MAPADVFSDDTSRPIQQGDIFLSTGIARIGAAGDFVPPARAVFETTRTGLAAGERGRPGLDVVAGRGLLMVVSHDCHLDKELNLAARALMANDAGLSADAAYARAEAGGTLDRYRRDQPAGRHRGCPGRRGCDHTRSAARRAGRRADGAFSFPVSYTQRNDLGAWVA